MTSIGRYELVGPLAIGGMAEVLLARVRGPSGFERPVVIKRILPHVARDPDFRQMFLDEARIAARIRHPNVVAVEELGEEADNLFLVMEYLEGESLSTIGKRHKKQGVRLPPHLAAHVVAEACAGLHAAHELTGPDGVPLGVVHRDISPQNVFVLYNGHVKVIDFGIAKATNSESRTQAGQVKGKFSYMSPEQCRAERVDRRSDIFALGILLYELSTGTRLFERAHDLLVLRAVCEDPMASPSSLVPNYPQVLERICSRALDRDPSRRYESAAAMRRDLLGALRQLAPSEPSDELGALMSRLFPDRIGQKKAMLTTLERGDLVTNVPPGEDSFRSGASRPNAGLLPPVATWKAAPPPMPLVIEDGLPTRTAVIADAGPPAPQVPARKRWPFVVVGVTVLTAAAALIPLSMGFGSRSAGATPSAAATSPAPSATSTGQAGPAPSADATATASVAAVDSSAPVASASATPASSTSAASTARWKPAPQSAPKGTPKGAPTATATSTGFRRFD